MCHGAQKNSDTLPSWASYIAAGHASSDGANVMRTVASRFGLATDTIREFCPEPVHIGSTAGMQFTRTFSMPAYELRRDLLPDPKLADYVAVAICIAALEIIKETAALADKHEKSTARAMILLVCLEMFGELADALAQNRDLDLRAAGVRVMRAELLNDVCLACGCQHCFGLLLIV